MHIIKIDTKYNNDLDNENLNESIVNGLLKYCGENPCGYLVERVIYSGEEIYVHLKEFISKYEYEHTIRLLKSIYRAINMLQMRTGLEYKSSVVDEDLIEAGKRDLYLLRIDCERNFRASDEQCLDFIKSALTNTIVEEPVNMFSTLWPIDQIVDYLVEASALLNLGCINISCIDKKIIYGWRLTEYFSDILSIVEKVTVPMYIKKGIGDKKSKLRVSIGLNKIPHQGMIGSDNNKFVLPPSETMH